VIRKKIKVLRSDNGGEYTNIDFTGFCTKEGIRREWIAPYNCTTKWSSIMEEQVYCWGNKIDVV